MGKHNITRIDSPVAIYVSDEEVYMHGAYHFHVWQQENLGAPVNCSICGQRYPTLRKPKEVIRKEIWGRIRERLQSGEYGYA